MTLATPETAIFETLESEVRSYCRDWPTVFEPRGSWISRLYDEGDRSPRLLRGRRRAQLRAQQPRAEARVDRLPGAGRRSPRSSTCHDRQARLPATTFGRTILRPRDLAVQGPVPRPDRHERGRGRAEAGAQGDRPRVGRRLHQRLPRHDARLARRHRQRAASGPGPESRWCTPRRCRTTATSTAPRPPTSSGWSECSTTAARGSTARPRSSSRPCRARAVSTSPAPSGCVRWPRLCERAGHRCSSSTTSRWAAGVPGAFFSFEDGGHRTRTS